jgi:hypothetical protein
VFQQLWWQVRGSCVLSCAARHLQCSLGQGGSTRPPYADGGNPLASSQLGGQAGSIQPPLHSGRHQRKLGVPTPCVPTAAVARLQVVLPCPSLQRPALWLVVACAC